MAQLPPHPRPLPTARKSSREEGSGEAVLISHDQQQAMAHYVSAYSFLSAYSFPRGRQQRARCAATASLRPQAELAHQRAPFGLFRVDVGGLLLRRAAKRIAALIGD